MRPTARRSAGWIAALVGAAILPAAASGRSAESGGACEVVPPGDALAERLADAAEGAVLCLGPGEHEGPLRLTRRVTIRGDHRATIHSAGRDSTISVEADGVVLEGFRVDGSGSRFDLLDAAVRVRANGVRVEGLEIRNALFGILAEQCRDLVVRDNHIIGRPEQTLGLRGDAIRIWEVRGARIERNRVQDSRDLVVWYSEGNFFSGNDISGGRYGMHLMYSHRNRIERSRFSGNVVGIFAMYSRELEIDGNWIAESGGAAGVGIGAKESGGLRIRDNWLIGNTIGIYLDTSPLHPDETNRIEGNVIRFGDVGIVFHGPASRNHLVANRFADHHVTVRVEGRASALDAEWRGNDYDDYAGYDLDGDGVGDVPYVLRSLEADLADRAPAIRFFRGTPAMSLVEWLGRIVPIFEARVLLEDPAPAMHVAAPPDPPRGLDAG